MICPTVAELSSFALGDLSEERIDQISQHLAGCLECEERITKIGPTSDSFVSLIHRVGIVVPPLDDSAYHRFQRGIAALGTDSNTDSGDSRYVSLSTDPSVSVPQAFGPYQLTHPLGRGGMGVVYRAWHTHLKRPVAIKFLPKRRSDDAEFIRRFTWEMEAVAKIDDPRVVRAMDAGAIDGLRYLVMEFIEGTDLLKLVTSQRVVPIPDACELVRHAALALEAIHRKGLVHRDIKPSNLMLSSEGQVKLLDMGLSRQLNRIHDDNLTVAGQLLGTVDYMAPEQIKGTATVDVRADIYSLGCTLYKLLTGVAPFSSPEYSTGPSKLLAHCSDRPVPVGQRRSGVSAELQAVVERMLAKDPLDRYASPLDVSQALVPFAIGSNLERLAAIVAKRNLVESVEALTDTTRSSLAVTPRRIFRPRYSLPKVWIGSILAIAILLGGIALVATRFGSFDRSSMANGGPRGASNSQALLPAISHPSETERLFWRRLLMNPVREVFWPHGDGLSDWRQDYGKEQVVAHCSGRGLLKVGHCGDDFYKLQLGVHQSRWTGGMGLFFGLQVVEGKNLLYRLLEVRRSVLDDGSEVYYVFHCRIIVRFDSEQRRSFDVQNLAAAAIQIPPGQLLLEAEMYRGRLAVVLVNGIALPELLNTVDAQKCADDVQHGKFGCSISNCAGVFRDARIMLLDDIR